MFHIYKSNNEAARNLMPPFLGMTGQGKTINILVEGQMTLESFWSRPNQ